MKTNRCSFYFLTLLETQRCVLTRWSSGEWPRTRAHGLEAQGPGVDGRLAQPAAASVI